MQATATKPKEAQVGMSQIGIGRDTDSMTSVLGSCVGIAIYDQKNKIGGYAHVVLADSNGRSGSPGKYVDTAVPHLVTQLVKAGADVRSLVAKIAGGASMFGGSSSIQIGADNIGATLALLSTMNVPLIGKHTGGNKGRKVTFDCSTCILTVEVFDSPTVKL